MARLPDRQNYIRVIGAGLLGKQTSLRHYLPDIPVSYPRQKLDTFLTAKNSRKNDSIH